MGNYIIEDNLSSAWLSAVQYILNQSGLQCNNLMVEIRNPLERNLEIEQNYESFCIRNDIKHFSIPAATIFPKKAFEILGRNRLKLYDKYPRLHKCLKGSWGSYFGQMIGWKLSKNSNVTPINQLEQIIKRINTRQRIYTAAYTIQIANPIDHSSYVIGGPCLHYIFLQLDSSSRAMNMLAIYRNHDFAIKAYGNYVGLGHLLEFLCSETNFNIGKLTCVSSHAFINSNYQRELNHLLGGTVTNEL